MKRLVFLVILAGTAWYGWHHYRDLLHRTPSHDAVIENRSGRDIVRVRLTVDGQTYVKERIASEADAVIPFRVGNDATFQMVWQWDNAAVGEQSWSGGLVPRGPMVQRHHLTIDPDGGVLYRAEQKVAPAS